MVVVRMVNAGFHVVDVVVVVRVFRAKADRNGVYIAEGGAHTCFVCGAECMMHVCAWVCMCA